MRGAIRAGAVRAFLLLLSPCVLAQDDVAAEAPVQTVQIRGIRDPALLPYADVVMLRRVFAGASGGGAIRAGIKVSSKQEGGQVENLHVSLAADGKRIEVPLKSGFVPLAELPTTDDAAAEFLTNQRKGALQIEILLIAELRDPRRFALGELAQALDQGNGIRRRLLPWYVRAVVPAFQRADVCFAAPGGEASIVQGGLHRVISASASDCLTLPLDNVAGETGVELNTTPLYVRLR